MNILGLSFFYHDASAALLIDGIPVAMSEEERFSRKKHDFDYPEKAIEFVLKQGKITPKELDWVVFYEKPFLKFERIIKTSLATYPLAPWVFQESTKNLFTSRVWIRELICKKLKIPQEKVLFAEHHLSHAASAYYCSPHNKAAILTVDGVGEWASTTVGVGDGNEIKILREIHFPHSLGLLYSTFTAFLGFEVNEGEYKVMGMAPYGKPDYINEVKQIIRLFTDGSFELNLDYFTFYRSAKQMYSSKFTKLFGKSRDPESKFFTRATGWPSYFGEKPEGETYRRMAAEQERYADIAASIQAVLEEAVVNLAQEVHRATGLDHLCFAGGVALNSCANWKILKNTPFKSVYIQPAAGDSGGALGAAMAAYHQIFNRPRGYVMNTASYGQNYSHDEIRGFIQTNNLKAEFIEDDDKLLSRVAETLTDGKVAGWLSGKFEWGPRALGNRSILADPRRAEMKDIVNTKIKFREPYRPFAPSVLAEKAEQFFDLPNRQEGYDPARFMLYVVDVLPEKQSLIPAITHVDGSARPQTVFKDTSPRYYNLIQKFNEATGIPLIMNTSFNLKGEPMVNSPADAYSTFRRSGIDLLVLENWLIFKNQTA